MVSGYSSSQTIAVFKFCLRSMDSVEHLGPYKQMKYFLTEYLPFLFFAFV
jgi:hypothetical protein